MAEIINLRRQRKARARAEQAAEAAANRAKHGLTGAERRRRQAEAEQERRRLDGLLLEGQDKNDEDEKG